MAGLQALFLLIVMPAIAWVIALFALQSARGELDREGPPKSDQASSGGEGEGGRILAYLGYSGIPVLFGLFLYASARPALDAIDGRPTGNVVRLEPLLLWASFAFSVASCSAIAAQTWIMRSRLRALVGSEFGRVLPLSVVPATAVIFALILVLLLLGNVDSVLAGGPASSDSALSSAIGSFQAFAVGTVAFPVAAGFSNRVRELSQRGFTRAILIMEVGELPVLLGLVQTFLALRSL